MAFIIRERILGGRKSFDRARQNVSATVISRFCERYLAHCIYIDVGAQVVYIQCIYSEAIVKEREIRDTEH